MKTRHYILTVIFAVFILVIIGRARWTRPYDLRTEQAAARAEGIPLTAAEFPQIAPPAGQNALPIYLALGKAFEAKKLDTASILPSTSNRPEVVLKGKTAALKALLDSRPDVGRLVHAAVARPHLYQQHTWTIYELFPYMAHVRTAAKWIQWESTLLARQGRYEEAVKHQALGFRIARQMSEDPILVSYLVGIACEEITLKGFEDIISEAGPNAAVAEAVRREIAAYDAGDDLTRSLKGEMVFGLGKMNGLPGDRISEWWYSNPSWAVHIHWMTRTIKAARMPAPERSKAMEAVAQEMKHAMGMRPTAVLAGLLIPVFTKAGSRSVQAESRRTLVSAMAAVLLAIVLTELDS